MKQKERSFSFSYILILLLFTLYTAGIHDHIFIKYYLQFLYLSFDHMTTFQHNYIISSQCYSNIDIIIILSLLYHHIIIKQNHYISCNNCNCIYKIIITGEIIQNYRRITKKKSHIIIGSKTHLHPLYTN